MNETLTTNRASEIAAQLVEQLLTAPVQDTLFEIDPAKEMNERWQNELRNLNPDKLVLDADFVDDFRYLAAMYGAGFHPTQFEDISFEEAGESGTAIYVDPIGLEHSYQIAKKVGRHNRMKDEINEELFTILIPTTGYDLSSCSYITTPEDLQKIFEFDYTNLEACRDLGFDLLYERKD
jgi:hypothetical protein